MKPHHSLYLLVFVANPTDHFQTQTPQDHINHTTLGHTDNTGDMLAGFVLSGFETITITITKQQSHFQSIIHWEHKL